MRLQRSVYVYLPLYSRLPEYLNSDFSSLFSLGLLMQVPIHLLSICYIPTASYVSFLGVVLNALFMFHTALNILKVAAVVSTVFF